MPLIPHVHIEGYCVYLMLATGLLDVFLRIPNTKLFAVLLIQNQKSFHFGMVISLLYIIISIKISTSIVLKGYYFHPFFLLGIQLIQTLSNTNLIFKHKHNIYFRG